ncbi:hypothetical protein Hanom_Chr16g01426621 [Helianthus anomalus]
MQNLHLSTVLCRINIQNLHFQHIYAESAFIICIFSTFMQNQHPESAFIS